MTDERPPSRGRAGDNVRTGTPLSVPESTGAETIAAPSTFNPSIIAEEVAEDMTLSLFASVTGDTPLSLLPDEDGPLEDVVRLRSMNDQLLAELESSRSEMEFALLKEEEMENRIELSQKTIQKLQQEVNGMAQQLQQVNNDHKDKTSELSALYTENQRLDGEREKHLHDAARTREDLEVSQAELENAWSHREGNTRELEEERNDLREQVSRLESQLSLMESKDMGERTSMATTDLPPEGSEYSPLLAAAYKQISELNTHLAETYKELTLSRTQAQQLAAQQNFGEANPNAASNTVADTQKQSQQIADLVSDIRHLHLDLEYHQQKLDDMIGEKQQMMKDLKKAQTELAESKLQIEERDQMLKHKDVDLKHLMDNKNTTGGHAASADQNTLVALRAEAAAKDSALIVSHYELHKEKLLRDRLEQKNLKLMERMQKLMMVVETMRKDNVTLERSLATKERSYEDRDLQLRQMTQKAKQLQKTARAAKAAHKAGKVPQLELESVPQQALPAINTLSQSHRSIHSAGSRSGVNTPRTPGRAPPSPYMR